MKQNQEINKEISKNKINFRQYYTNNMNATVYCFKFYVLSMNDLLYCINSVYKREWFENINEL